MDMTVRMGCPYVLCSAVVEAVWTRYFATNPASERLMIPYHQINHPIIRAACPASNMWIPLEPGAAESLTNIAMSHFKTIQEHMDRQDELGPPQRDRQARDGGVFPIRPVNDSGVPIRIGREPVTEGDQADWNPPRPGDPENQPVPPDVGGQHLGKGSGRHVASVREIVAQVQAANLQASEAAASTSESAHVLAAAKASIEGAKSQIAAAIDGSGAQTLGEYLAMLEEAEQKIDQAIPALEEASARLVGGMEKGETYIGMALG